jgi:hypothetical protein
MQKMVWRYKLNHLKIQFPHVTKNCFPEENRNNLNLRNYLIKKNKTTIFKNRAQITALQKGHSYEN